MKGTQELQKGSPGSYCWTSPGGSGTWVYQCQDLTSGYPAAERVKAGSRLRIRFLKEQRPIDISLVAHVERTKDGDRQGAATYREAETCRRGRANGCVGRSRLRRAPQSPLLPRRIRNLGRRAQWAGAGRLLELPRSDDGLNRVSIRGACPPFKRSLLTTLTL